MRPGNGYALSAGLNISTTEAACNVASDKSRQAGAIRVANTEINDSDLEEVTKCYAYHLRASLFLSLVLP